MMTPTEPQTTPADGAPGASRDALQQPLQHTAQDLPQHAAQEASLQGSQPASPQPSQPSQHPLQQAAQDPAQAGALAATTSGHDTLPSAAGAFAAGAGASRQGEAPFALRRNAFGKLVLTDDANLEHEGVVPVRAFPVQAPDEGISMMSEDGHEVFWIERLADLPAAILALVTQELDGREFMPAIETIHSVSSYSTPCTWHVETDRGKTSFVLRGEEDIRRIGAVSLLVADNHGINFLIRDPALMDRASKKILDRFL